MAVTSVQGCRLEWIDWMKTIGIYLVVLGHFDSYGNDFIYAFHMPLFFIISGFLCKKEDNQGIFWKKLWFNLVVPMLIIAAANFVYACILQLIDGSFEFKTFYWFVRNVLFGMVSGFDNLWFVYTLILLKIIFQYCRSSVLFYALTVVMLTLAYIYNNYDLSAFPFFMKEPNAIVDVCTAYPFFALGILLHDYKAILKEWNHKGMLVLMGVCGFLLVFICCSYNGSVGLHCSDYGGNMLLCLLGGVSGSMMVFAVSKLLGHASKYVVIISRGTIIILGFQKIIIALVRAFFPASYADIVFAFIIVILFIPLIIWTERYFPLMAGKYRINKIHPV